MQPHKSVKQQMDKKRPAGNRADCRAFFVLYHRLIRLKGLLFVCKGEFFITLLVPI